MNTDDFLCEMQEIGLEARPVWKAIILEECLRIEFTNDGRCLMRCTKLGGSYHFALINWPFDLSDVNSLVTWFTRYPKRGDNYSEIETDGRSELSLSEVCLLVKELNRRGYFKMLN